MPFYRFEQFEGNLLTPHLSSARAPVQSSARGGNRIEGMTPAEQTRAWIGRRAN